MPELAQTRNIRSERARDGEENPAVFKRWAAEGKKPPSYFRSYEQVRDAMKKIATDHPTLATVVDIGDSYEKTKGKADRDLMVIKLTSPKAAPNGKKPSVLYFGGQHAREIANPEMLMRFANWLVDNYGKDPQATALLDTREIHLLPILNPDGHAVIERGYNGQPGGDLMKRTNTSGKDGSGVDLNRNWATKNWGTAGVTHSPGGETYCGTGPASEVEIQALQKYIEETKVNLTIDWHSYSELVLYPPDDDASHTTPDQASYVRQGKKMASYNHYTPEASIELYLTSGGSFWPYERQGTASFAIETGRSFHQSDRDFEETWKLNFPVLQYAATIADDWKKSSDGPDITSVQVNGGEMRVMTPGVACELVRDINAKPGSGVKVAGTSGMFDLKGVFSAADGRELAYVRAQDAEGNWGPLRALWITGRARTMGAIALRAEQNAVARKRA